ncbi:DNA relaxase NicK [Lysobacter niastensis]|uniref:DNA relaxase NicK n=1 Tax=Lysobacter niastensis TaxID=380629 RepID=A0ABU1WE09_9GAMM|nr:replication initiation factor domain-containing protein [Lysobacter niastensis]MDR7135721.1 DNA relaxase NicK [Lysobacter niastensis]
MSARPLVAFAVAGLPTTNRGVSLSGSAQLQPLTTVVVDWMAGSVDLAEVLAHQGHLKTWEIFNDLNGYGFQTQQVAACVFSSIFAGTDLHLCKEQRKGTFYKWRHHLISASGEKVGQIEFGGPHTMRQDGTPTARVELTGKGCRLFEGAAESDHAERWSSLRAKLASVAGRLSRVDIAFDDFAGTYNLAHAVKLWQSGKFDARGQTPDLESVNHAKGLKGDTIYIGSRASEKFLRVYEKGKEQGDESSVWVRWEAQFKASSRRELDLDMLTAPAEFMRGAYRALSFISETLRRLDLTKEQAAANIHGALKHLRRQYGKTLNFLKQTFPDDEALGSFLINVTRPGLPDWSWQYLGQDGYLSVLDAMRVERQQVAKPLNDGELCHAR